MADMSKIQALSLQSNTLQHQVLQEEQEEQDEIRISSSQQTLDNSITNCSSLVEDDDDDDDDDLVNVDEGDILPYTFNFDPFSPIDSSFFVPSHHHHHHNPQVNSNSCSCCSCESDSESESESDRPDSTVYPDCLYGNEEEYDQMDFITDLFDSRGEIEHVSGRDSQTDVGISVSEAINDHHDDDDFVSSNIEELGLGFEGGGLRVVRIESESESNSDTEELGQVNDQNDERIQITDLNLEHFWDCPTFDTARVDDRDGLSSVIDRIEEISVSSEISSVEDSAVGVLEWEILLAVNNLERDLEFETNGDEGFVYTAEFDTLIGQFVETVRALRGSPPAAKSIIDNLPLVILKTNDSKDADHDQDQDQDHDQDNVICAVCKDEILMEEKVTQLPCRHHYHGDCIVPWLSIRNTCPVCRFELPTDDVDYERSKNRVNDDELVVGYGSQLSP